MPAYSRAAGRYYDIWCDLLRGAHAAAKTDTNALQNIYLSDVESGDAEELHRDTANDHHLDGLDWFAREIIEEASAQCREHDLK